MKPKSERYLRQRRFVFGDRLRREGVVCLQATATTTATRVSSAQAASQSPHADKEAPQFIINFP
jgi:hypothetical protein